MPGELDLEAMLATLTVSRRPSTYSVVSIGHSGEVPSLGAGVEAVLIEDEGTTVVCTLEVARHWGWPVEFEAAWLTVDVHSSLEAVGLTAAMSAALAVESIPCNVLAGYYHDHLLVPVSRVVDAVRCLEALRDR